MLSDPNHLRGWQSHETCRRRPDANHCPRRRRPEYPDLGFDGARGRQLSGHHLLRRNFGEGFSTSPPDLAVLDIKMPRMGGMELLRRVRKTSDLPVIFLTSREEEIDELCGLKLGAD